MRNGHVDGGRYVPALDGLRAICVILVFAFHVGAPWAVGGFLGVSVFFTLSGYLITSGLLRTGASTGSLELSQFWARRLRRLLPAALVAVGLVLLLAAVGMPVDPDGLRGDVIASLANVANWRFLLDGSAYADLFGAPSPLLHFWSLAIEEQFYVLFPLALWCVWRRRASDPRRLRGSIRTVALVGIAVSVVFTVVAAAAGAVDVVYYSLPSRAAELLAGALLATSTKLAPARGRGGSKLAAAIGVVAFATLVALCGVTAVNSLWVGAGGLSLMAIVSCALIGACVQRGPVAMLLGITPLRQLGRISYGVYLFHWPVILWLTPERVGVDGAPLLVLRIAVTLLISYVSFVVVEQPIRQRRVLRGPWVRVVAPAGCAMLAIGGVLVTSTLAQSLPVDLNRDAEKLSTAVEESRRDQGGAPVVSFFGDSTALETGLASVIWGDRNDLMEYAVGVVELGCGLAREGTIRYEQRVFEPGADCGSLESSWGAAADRTQPDIAVIQVGPLEAADHQLPGEAQWRAPGDPTFDRWLIGRMRIAADVFLSRDIAVVWLTSPDIDTSRLGPSGVGDPASDTSRMRRFNQLLRDVAASRPTLRVVDLAGWMRGPGAAIPDAILRPDGVHFDHAVAARELLPWLGPRILSAASRSPGSD